MSKKRPATVTTRVGRWVLLDEGSNSINDTHSAPVPVPETVVRHPKFFFDNVLVSIQVENTLFNVHKYQLAKSEVFSDMFKMPKAEDNRPEEGSSPEHPIIMSGIAASDFAALLTSLYANQFSDDQLVPEVTLIVPAFRLANMFNFSVLRKCLLPLAEKGLGDVDKIVFAREFDIKEWLVPAYTRLCQREERLSVEEARKLEVDSVLMISHLGEQYRRAGNIALSGNYFCYNTNCGSRVVYGRNTRCGKCNTNLDLYRVEPGTTGASNNTNNTTIEEKVKQWVEDNYAAKE